MEPTPEHVDYQRYALLALVALCGSIARAGKWTDDNGKFSLQKLAAEIATALVLGAIAAGAGAYWNVSPPIVGAIAGCLGLLGPAAIVGVITAKLGDITNGTSKPE
jgi:hypothetical protein